MNKSREFVIGASNSYSSNRIRTSSAQSLTTFRNVVVREFFTFPALYFFVVAFLEVFVANDFYGKTTAFTLAFAAACVISRELFYNLERVKYDREVNNKEVFRIHSETGKMQRVCWKHLKVGDIIKLADGQEVPADAILINSSDPEYSCQVETVNLDGETHLKSKSCLTETQDRTIKSVLINECRIHMDSLGIVSKTHGEFTLATPDGSEFSCQITDKNVLLRGSTVQHVKWVFAIVAFAGEDTRLMAHLTENREVKRSRMALVLSGALMILTAVILVTSILFASFGTVWRRSNTNHCSYLTFLPCEKERSIDTDAFLEAFLLFFSTASNIAPISIIICLSLLRRILVYKMTHDSHLEKDDLKCRSVHLIEDLGQVDHIFVDKTGTLTTNKMVLRKLSVAGICYGEEKDKENTLEDESQNMVREVIHETTPEKHPGMNSMFNNIMRRKSRHQLSRAVEDEAAPSNNLFTKDYMRSNKPNISLVAAEDPKRRSSLKPSQDPLVRKINPVTASPIELFNSVMQQSKNPNFPAVFERHEDFDFKDTRLLTHLQRLHDIECHNKIIRRLESIPLDGINNKVLEHQPLPKHAVLLREALRCIALCHSVVAEPITELDEEEMQYEDKDISSSGLLRSDSASVHTTGSLSTFRRHVSTESYHSITRKLVRPDSHYQLLGGKGAMRRQSSTRFRVPAANNITSIRSFRESGHNSVGTKNTQLSDLQTFEDSVIVVKRFNVDAESVPDGDEINTVGQLPNSVKNMLIDQIRTGSVSTTNQMQVEQAEIILEKALRTKSITTTQPVVQKRRRTQSVDIVEINSDDEMDDDDPIARPSLRASIAVDGRANPKIKKSSIEGSPLTSYKPIPSRLSTQQDIDNESNVTNQENSMSKSNEKDEFEFEQDTDDNLSSKIPIRSSSGLPLYENSSDHMESAHSNFSGLINGVKSILRSPNKLPPKFPIYENLTVAPPIFHRPKPQVFESTSPTLSEYSQNIQNNSGSATPNFSSEGDSDNFGSKNSSEPMLRKKKSMYLQSSNHSNAVEFRSTSPDENALLLAARCFGFAFQNRVDDTIHLNEFHKHCEYSVLAINHFSHSRRRMSVLVETPDREYILYVKGADSSMLNILLDEDEMEGRVPYLPMSEDDHQHYQHIAKADIHDFASKGLRVIVLGCRKLPRREMKNWLLKYDEAKRSNDELKSDAAAGLIEKDLELIGSTGIEDTIEDGAAPTVKRLLEAKSHMWMVTGDMQETAMNTAFATGILAQDSTIVAIRDSTAEIARESLVTKRMDMISRGAWNVGTKQSGLSLCISGKGFGHIVNNAVAARNSVVSMTSSNSKTTSSNVANRHSMIYGPIQPSSDYALSTSFRRNSVQAVPSSKNSTLQESTSPSTVTPSSILLSTLKSQTPTSTARRHRRSLGNLPKNISTLTMLPKPNESHFSRDWVKRTMRKWWRKIKAVVYRSVAPAGSATNKSNTTSITNRASATSVPRQISQQNLNHDPIAKAIDSEKRQRQPLVTEFLDLASQASTVICYRMEPHQKAQLVRIIRSLPSKPVTLAIGDGGNDVPMIQEAHIGIGISGNEGNDASRAGDFVLSKFHVLGRLLLIHGRFNLARMSTLLSFMILKSVLVTTAIMLLSLFSGMDGSYFSPFGMVMWNLLLTTIPLLYRSHNEEYITQESAWQFPMTYNMVKTTTYSLLRLLLVGVLQAVTVLILYAAFIGTFPVDTDGMPWGVIETVDAFFFLLVCTSNLYLLLSTKRIDWKLICLSFVCTMFFFVYHIVAEQLSHMFDIVYQGSHVIEHLIDSPPFWLLLIIPFTVSLFVMMIRFFYNFHYPSFIRIIQEWDAGFRASPFQHIANIGRSLTTSNAMTHDATGGGEDGVFVGLGVENEYDDDGEDGAEIIGTVGTVIGTVDRGSTGIQSMASVSIGEKSKDQPFQFGSRGNRSSFAGNRLGSMTEGQFGQNKPRKYLSPFGAQRNAARGGTVDTNHLFKHQTEMNNNNNESSKRSRSKRAQRLLFKEKAGLIARNHRTLEKVMKNLERVSKTISAGNGGVSMADTVIDDDTPLDSVLLNYKDRVLDRLFFQWRMEGSVYMLAKFFFVFVIFCIYLTFLYNEIRSVESSREDMVVAVCQVTIMSLILISMVFRKRMLHVYQTAVFCLILTLGLLESCLERSTLFIGGVEFALMFSLELEMFHIILNCFICLPVILINNTTSYTNSILLICFGIIAVACINRIWFSHRLFFYRTNTNQMNQLRSVQLLHNLAPAHIVPLLRLDCSETEILKRKQSLYKGGVRYTAYVSPKHQKAVSRAKLNRRSSVRHTKFSNANPTNANTALNVIAQQESSITVIFVNICNFSQLLVEFEPRNVVWLLDRIYTMLDELCESHGLYKVESVGSCYMACCGLNGSYALDHTTRVIEFAQNAMRCLNRVCGRSLLRITTGSNQDKVKSTRFIEARCGIHSGRIIAGVIGVRKPQFCLFGDTVNTSSRMMSTAKPGDIVCSADAHRLASDQHKFVPRKIIAKGKGELTTYVVQSDVSTEGSLVDFIKRSTQQNASKLDTSVFESKSRQIPLSKTMRFPEDHELKFTNEKTRQHLWINIGLMVFLGVVHIFLFVPESFRRFKVLVQDSGNDEAFSMKDLLTMLYLAYYLLRCFGSAYIINSVSLRNIRANVLIFISCESMVLPLCSLGSFQLLTYTVLTVALLSVTSSLRFCITFPVSAILSIGVLTFTIIKDVPRIGYIADFIFLITFITMMAFLSEGAARNAYRKEHQIEDQTKEIQRLLHLMLPPNVISLLQHGVAYTASRFSNVSILYCDIKGFTSMCSCIEAEIVVGLLNEMFSKFDDLTSRDDKLFKVQTIGDAYVIVSGIDMKQPLRNKDNDNPTKPKYPPIVPTGGTYSNSSEVSSCMDTSNISYSTHSKLTKKVSAADYAKTLIDCGVEMLQIVNSMINPVTGEPMQMRVGIHTGTVIGGVIGRRTLRYDIWGLDAIIANKLEEAGTPGSILISDTTKMLIENDLEFISSFDVSEEDPIKMNGHEPVPTHLLTPHLVVSKPLQFKLREEDTKLFGDFIVKI
eukprot:TRINITY_DN398_c0_g5_i1.p1 TRINITY_DN398_c0_g5~~TRINITY_DN398_c0_g5_i1.p1  ORF type:complete len:3049 (+),score=701.94 TRINITY_DN398_c0_g5_i1:73-9219(+)